MGSAVTAIAGGGGGGPSKPIERPVPRPAGSTVMTAQKKAPVTANIEDRRRQTAGRTIMTGAKLGDAATAKKDLLGQ